MGSGTAGYPAQKSQTAARLKYIDAVLLLLNKTKRKVYYELPTSREREAARLTMVTRLIASS